MKLFLNTENQSPDETVEAIAAFITGLAEERRLHG